MQLKHESREIIKYMLARREFIPCLLPHHHINFTFSFDFRLSHWLRRPGEHSMWLDLWGEDDPSTLTTAASVYFEQPLSYDLVREALEEAVLPLSEDGKQALAEAAWREAVEAAGAVGGADDVGRYCLVDLEFQVVVRNHHIYDLEELD